MIEYMQGAAMNTLTSSFPGTYADGSMNRPPGEPEHPQQDPPPQRPSDPIDPGRPQQPEVPPIDPHTPTVPEPHMRG